MFGGMRRGKEVRNIFSIVERSDQRYIRNARTSKGFFLSPYNQLYSNEKLVIAWRLYWSSMTMENRVGLYNAMQTIVPEALLTKEYSLYNYEFIRQTKLPLHEFARLRASLVPQPIRKLFRPLKDYIRTYPDNKLEYAEWRRWAPVAKRIREEPRPLFTFRRPKLFRFCTSLLSKKRAITFLNRRFEGGKSRRSKRVGEREVKIDFKKRLSKLDVKFKGKASLSSPVVCNTYLVIQQLIEVNAVLGHLMKNSLFLARWFLYGVYSAKEFFKFSAMAPGMYDIFIIDMCSTILMLRSVLFLGRGTGLGKPSVWFICYNEYFSALSALYAILCGGGYSTISWLAGSLTNFKRIMVLFYRLYVDWRKGLKIPKKNYFLMFRFFQFRLAGTRVPSFIFFCNTLRSKLALREVGLARIGSVAVIDSNVLSFDVDLPIPSNDDSMLSVNFFSYLITHMILSGRVVQVKKFNNYIRNFKKLKLLFVLYYVLLFLVNTELKWFNSKLRFFILSTWK